MTVIVVLFPTVTKTPELGMMIGRIEIFGTVLAGVVRDWCHPPATASGIASRVAGPGYGEPRGRLTKRRVIADRPTGHATSGIHRRLVPVSRQ